MEKRNLKLPTSSFNLTQQQDIVSSPKPKLPTESLGRIPQKTVDTLKEEGYTFLEAAPEVSKFRRILQSISEKIPKFPVPGVDPREFDIEGKPTGLRVREVRAPFAKEPSATFVGAPGIVTEPIAGAARTTEFAVDALQFGSRLWGGIPLTIKRIQDPEKPSILETQEDDSLIQKTIQTAVFGTEPVKDWATLLNEWRGTTESVGRNLQKSHNKYYQIMGRELEDRSISYTAPIIVGAALIDFTGSNKVTRTLVSQIKKGGFEDVYRLLLRRGVPDEIARSSAQRFGNMTNAGEIETGLHRLQEMMRSVSEVPTPPRRAVTPETSLTQEAKKYKTADEFVKAQGTPVYHGTANKFDNFSEEFIGSGEGATSKGFWFTSLKREADSKAAARAYYNRIINKTTDEKGFVVEAYLDIKNPKIINLKGLDDVDPDNANILAKTIERDGFDGLIYKNVKMADGTLADHIVAINPSQIKTKSQLTDIWKKANIADEIARPTMERGRLTTLDNEIRLIDKQTDKISKQITTQRQAGKTTLTLEREQNSLWKKRDLLDQQRANIVSPDEASKLRGNISVRPQVFVDNVARGVKTGSVTTQKDILKAGKELKQILKTEGVDPSDMKWFTDTFKGIKGVSDLAEKLPTIYARIDRLANAREIGKLRTAITREMKQAKPRFDKKTKVRVSSYGPETQGVLDILRGVKNIDGKTPLEKAVKGKGFHLAGNRGEALNEIANLQTKYGSYVDGVPVDVPASVARKMALLDMVGVQDMSVTELRRTLKNLQSLKEEGKMNTLRALFNKETEIQLVVDTAKEEFKFKRGKFGKFFGLKEKPPVMGEVGKEIHPVAKILHTMENILLGHRNIMEKLTFQGDFKVADWSVNKIITARNTHTVTNAKWTNPMTGKFKEIFGEKKMGKTLGQLNERKLVTTLEDGTEIRLSQMEAAYWWAQMKDPTQLSRFINGMKFTSKTFKAIDDFLDPKMKQYTEYLQYEWLPMIRKDVDPRFRTKFGMEMPENPNYIPITTTEIPVDDVTNLFFGEAFPHWTSTIPSSLKARTGSKIPFQKIGIDSVMRRHSMQMNQFLSFDEAVSDLRRVMMNTEVRDVIKAAQGGNELYKTALKKIDDIARGGVAAQMTIVGLDKWVRNFTKASLMFNVVPFVKQLTSFPAFTLGRGSLSWRELASGGVAFSASPVKWTKMFANESDMIFNRLTTGFNREIQLAFKKGDDNFFIQDVNMSLGQFLENAVVTPTRGGDMVPILPGMTSKYLQTTKYLERTTKLTAEQIHRRAITEAEKLVTRTQQSPWIEDLGRIQSANSIGKGVAMYSTTPIQYFRETSNTVRMWNRGQMDTKSVLRGIITSWVVLPQMFQFASNGFNWNSERQMRALMLGPLNYYPAVGNLMGTFHDALFKGETWQNVISGISPLATIPLETQQMLARVYRILTDDDKSDEKKMKEWRKLAEEIYTITALTSGRLPSTAPRSIDGIIDLWEGDTEDPRRLFWSEWSLKTGNEVGTVESSSSGSNSSSRPRKLPTAPR